MVEDWMITQDWQNPKWNRDGSQPHHWHNYVSSAVQQIWQSFTDEQKQVLAAGFAEVALNEDCWD
ncbi:hypothetical protein [Serratia marcescens]|uniref:hypothetical protein n=1 Tax=Serratia marcescens TaxID=615 RepID=UPI0007452F46|nr:hypothetical protein [Serratia marcescens]CVA07710.1 Uncharacterised protein [Serratia marcescens]CVA10016.1 Uncharacterised protein [Serratia marcescens]